ncbi:MAG: DUF393 domain-containing protein [Gemmatimonadota bacterium]|nr:DUF393 domain-containing protein [Gemmatimonadota bacterium]
MRPAVLVYDGLCPFCTRWADRIRRWKSRKAPLEFLALPDPAASLISGKSMQELSEAMHLVLEDGRVVAGARAAFEILRFVKGGFAFHLLWRVPGVPLIANPVYRFVAARRRRVGCDGTHCGLNVDGDAQPR